MKIWLALAFFAVMTLLAPAPTRAEVINGINVVVNDAVITLQDVRGSVAPLMEVLAVQYRGRPNEFEKEARRVQEKGIQELVDRELILSEYKTAGYALSESVVDREIKDRMKQRFGDRATLAKTLQAQGITYETYRTQIREQIILEAMRQKNISSEKVVISPHKIEAYYQANQAKFQLDDQAEVRLIVINQTAEKEPGSAKKLAGEILKQLKSGATFKELASIYSDSGRDKGGYRGWVERSYFKKELADVAFSLKAGQISDVIDQPEAAYIISVENIRAAHVRPIDEVRAEIEATLKGGEKARLQERWLGRLREKSFVRYF